MLSFSGGSSHAFWIILVDDPVFDAAGCAESPPLANYLRQRRVAEMGVMITELIYQHSMTMRKIPVKKKERIIKGDRGCPVFVAQSITGGSRCATSPSERELICVKSID